MSTIMGIDPGKKGAVCILSESECTSWTMEQWLAEPLGRRCDHLEICDHAFVEKAQTYPGEGPVGAFKYGMGFGQILGFIEACHVQYTLVPPQRWSKEMHKGATGTAKEKSLQVVKRLFPTVELVQPRCRKPHDGIVDALLIAEYGRRVYR